MISKTADSGKAPVIKPKGAVLTLPPELKITNNEILLKRLKSVFDSEYSKITLDLRKVDNADLSSLQILLSFYKECMANDLQVAFRGPLKEVFSNRLYDCGFLEKGNISEVLFPFLGKKGAKIGNS